MTEKEIKVDQWYITNLIYKINNGDITKPKFQRKKKWDILPKKESKPNEKNYIMFLYETQNSVHAITLGENINTGRQTYTNIDGNNRINAICHFMKSPFDIFPEYLDNLYAFIDSKNFSIEIKSKVKNIFSSLSYDNIIKFKYHKFFIENDEKELYTNYLQILREAFDPIIEDLQNKLYVNNRDRFDMVVKITVNIFNGYTTEELAKIFEDINKFNSKLSEIELLACRLHGITNFEIKDNIIKTAIKDTLIRFYKKKSTDEILTCYHFNKDDNFNAYDFIVGFQDYCSTKCNFIEETNNEGASLFFKLYKTLYKGDYDNIFTTENINDFISKITRSIELLNKINKTVFTDIINEELFNKSCLSKLSNLKKNNVYFIIVSMIGFFNKNEKESIIINSIEKCLLYHFFINDISEKDKRAEFQLADMLTNAAGGSFIDSLADKIYKTPETICDKITRTNMSSLINILNLESNKPHERFLPTGKHQNDKRRDRKFYEKTLAFYYFKQHVPTNMLVHTFSIEHIFPNSSSWDNKMDKDRFGNIIPIIHDINISRGNRHISKYIELDKHGFIKFINDMIPSTGTYDSIISHDDKKPKITSIDAYNKFCEDNENRYLENFIKCLY